MTDRTSVSTGPYAITARTPSDTADLLRQLAEIGRAPGADTVSVEAAALTERLGAGRFFVAWVGLNEREARRLWMSARMKSRVMIPRLR